GAARLAQAQGQAHARAARRARADEGGAAGAEEQLTTAEARRSELLERVPNPPDEATPDGFTEEDAVEIRRWGDPPSFDFPARDHLELAEVYGWIDLERAAKVSGARFAYRIGDVALLELA